MSISVRRLIHRGAARDVVRDRIALEDALNTTLPQDGRLVLIRKLTVQGELASLRQRHGTVRRGWIGAVAGAVHAVSPFAGQANCVWFASPAEAEAMLLRKLLAGEPVVGWFWALAVPDWRYLPLVDWLPLRIAEYLRKPDHAALARIAQTCIEAGRATELIDATARALRVAPDHPVNEGGPLPSPGPNIAGRPRMGPSEEIPVASAVRRLRQSVLTPAWVAMLLRIEGADAPTITCRDLVLAILREKVRRASPALALDQRLLGEVAEALWAIAAGPLARPLAESGAPGGTAPAFPEAEESFNEASRAAPLRREAGGEASREGHILPAAQAEMSSEFDSAEAPVERPLEVVSRHAGLWLVVPPLIRLGFREWLSERPRLLGEDPGRRLILAVALHHDIPRNDPALSPLAIHEDAGENFAWIDPWRAGLDRWLRRTARRRTHDLVARAGRIAFDGDRLDIAYPLDAADLRLRRLALDSDAGWTDWLGLSVRFHFGGSRAL